ncbi:MAG: hypothetical protein ACR2HZ_09265 [Gemmatimonadaceae bacterium]|jgi:hypothetical protein
MQASPETVQQVWIITLVIYFVVVGVVALLLTLILRTARQIRTGVSAIWTTGQKIANNTIHIALLENTNQVAGQILESAKGVVMATGAVKAHAEGCPGCPACVLGPGWQR